MRFWEAIRIAYQLWRNPSSTYVPYEDLDYHIDNLNGVDDPISEKILEVMIEAREKKIGVMIE